MSSADSSRDIPADLLIGDALYANSGPKLLAIILVLRIVSFIIVCLRIWSRLVSKMMGNDDWVMIMATLSSVGLSVASGLGLRYESCQHIWILPEYYQVHADTLLYIDQILYPITLGLTKVSILLFYLHLSPSVALHRMVKVALAFVIAMTIGHTFAFTFQCTPVAYVYNYNNNNISGTCVNQVILNYTAAALNIVTDIWVYAIPMPMLWNLKCSRKQRIILVLIFSLGGITCIASMIRLKTLYSLSVSFDKTWILYDVVTWSAVETSTGIMTASLPAIKPLIDHFFPNLLNFSKHSQHIHSQGLSGAQSGTRGNAFGMCRTHNMSEDFSWMMESVTCSKSKDNLASNELSTSRSITPASAVEAHLEYV